MQWRSVLLERQAEKAMTMKERLKRMLGGMVFWSGFALTCLLLVPVCLLLICVCGIFSAADGCSARLRGTRA